MLKGVANWLWGQIVDLLVSECGAGETPQCDFDRLRHEVRPADAILVDGRTRVGAVIKTITQSPWTHSMLYLGRLHDIDSPELRARVQRFYDGDPGAQLVAEALLGQGTVISRLDNYRNDHLRICRARGLSRDDAQRIVGYAIGRLGTDYDVRQLLDLARFMFPYGLLPRRWRSSLFEHNAGGPTKTVCSTMMAEAFMSVGFPVLPVVEQHSDGRTRFVQRNPRLFCPRDFDYSPYFDIIKYPFWGHEDSAPYRHVPWGSETVFRDDDPYVVPAAETEDTLEETAPLVRAGVRVP